MRRSALFWAVLALALAGVIIYAPAEWARSATGPHEPVDFLTRPQEGWRFMLDAAFAIPSAKAATPAEARKLAVRDFAGTSVTPTRVDLLWVPNLRVRLVGGGGSRVVTAKARMVWMVTGRTRPQGPLRTVGLIDYSSGDLTYDVRNTR
ncbi:MAG: hypothetical protein ACTHNU_09285 [Gaiellales bacterium]